MKIAVTSKGDTLEDAVDPRFGRCTTFLIIDTEDMSFEVVDNQNVAAGGGAGIQSAQAIADKHATVVLTGNCGPNAYRTLEAAGIQIVTGANGTVRESVAQYLAGKLTPTEGPNVQSHAGMTMKLAIPVTEGKLSAHFGHCDTFALIDVDTEKKTILSTKTVVPPPHEPGILPRWLAEQGAQIIIAGGMGNRAQTLFEQQKIAVMVGAPSDTPEAIATAYVNQSLVTGDNVCDH